MRTLGFRTHLLLAIAGAAGILATLSRPWYGSAPPPAPEKVGDIGDINGPLNAFFDGMQRWVSDPNGVTGWSSLAHSGVALAAMAGVALVGSVMCAVPALQAAGRDMLRYGALAAFGIIAWRLFDPPGANEGLELRNGSLAAAGCSLVLLSCAMSVAAAPLRRKVPVAKYTAPAPPPAWESGPPN